MPRCRKEKSSRRVVYQQGGTPSKDGAWFQTHCDALSANQKDARKNDPDPRPLPARDMFAQKNGGKAHGDGSIERSKNADYRHLFHEHGAMAQSKGKSIKSAHASANPTDSSARKSHRLDGK